MYRHHASPLARVVQGIPDSWERVAATATFDEDLYDVVWSPCNRFIAVAKSQSVEVLDAVTLSRLSIFEKFSYATPYQWLSFSPDDRCLTLCVNGALISWDIQTGSSLGTIPLRPERLYGTPFSFKHSKDGKVIAVAFKPGNFRDSNFSNSNSSNSNSSDSNSSDSKFSEGDFEYTSFICTYDHHSGRHVGSHCFQEERIIHPMWTHDEYLRFATTNPESIRIWQSPFTLEHPPVEVASFPVTEWFTDADNLLFLPSLSRLAFVRGDTIRVRDLKAPKLLLESELTPYTYELFPLQGSLMSFSFDGRFFTYTTSSEGVHVWKESPTGYLPYRRLPFSYVRFGAAPQLSPNTESIIISLERKIHRLHTRDQFPSLSSASTGDSRPNDFTLGFSPDENFAAFARRWENMVTIIDLKSGESKWNIDVGLKISCVGMAGGTVIVVGWGSIVTWNLPSGDRTPNASINDIAYVTIHRHTSPPSFTGVPYYMSISPDLSRIVVARESPSSLEVYDVSTGSCLARISTGGLLSPRFTRDGCEVWVGNCDSFGEQCEIIEDGKSRVIELNLQRTEGPSREFFRESSRGYVVTDGCWVLSPGQKRLLWLPHRWRSDERNRAWGGRFLGLLDANELSEVVILEFLE